MGVDSARYEVQAAAAALPDGFVVAAADEAEDGKGKEGGTEESREESGGSGEDSDANAPAPAQAPAPAVAVLQKEQREAAIRRLEDLFDLYDAPGGDR